MKVIKRDGTIVQYDFNKIKNAISKAMIATKNKDDAHTEVAKSVENSIFLKYESTPIDIEKIQDIIQSTLVSYQEYDTAKNYFLYREEHNLIRQKIGRNLSKQQINYLKEMINYSTQNLDFVDKYKLLDQTSSELIKTSTFNDIKEALILSATSLIEEEPNYSKVASRILLSQINHELVTQGILSFEDYVYLGVKNRILNGDFHSKFNLNKLKKHIQSCDYRNYQFDYVGMKTLSDRYLLKFNNKWIESPQYLFMRVAMGMSLNEQNPTQKAIEFYDLISQFDYMPSTPTLFNSGLIRSQNSSCFVTTVEDSLAGIYKTLSDHAQLSKYSGGIGFDFTNVRSLGSYIKGIESYSSGVIPFLKIYNDSCIAISQGGKRRGSMCAYLETWHLDIEEFLESKKNTGDDRRRLHDMNTANWIPDLFMQRVKNDQHWTLFNPSDVPDLHELYSHEFKIAYENYESLARQGKIKLHKTVSAVSLWRKMLSMLFETGHPWITFKDAHNIRNANKYNGVIHSSNLCTEISLNTSDSETAVCNLGSINLANHVDRTSPETGYLNTAKIEKTIETAVRMLDNIIDINFYPTKEAENSNRLHRPIGLGVMGFQDFLYQVNLNFEDAKAKEISAKQQKLIAMCAYKASVGLAKEKGVYPSYNKNHDYYNIIDSYIDLLKNRDKYYDLKMSQLQDLGDESFELSKITSTGMRNVVLMSIAPTVTISNIVGVYPSIEPAYSNLYSKQNLSGNFTIINKYLINDLRKLYLWNNDVLHDLKRCDGSIQDINYIPQSLKDKYKTCFEINQFDLIDHASARQKYVDQAISLNLFVSKPSGKLLNDLYMYAWESCLKSTYYLRSLGASHVEKSTLDVMPKMCSIDNPECESCQ